jgi:cell division protein FtsN
LRNYDKAQYYLQKALKLSANNPVLKQEIETFLAKIERKKRYSETDEFSKTNIINENFFIEKPQIDEKKKKEIITKAFQDLDENVQEDEVIDLIKYQPPKKRIQTYSSRKKKTYRTDKKKYAKITEPRIKRRSEETIRETKRKTSQTTRRKKLITYRYKPEKKVIKPKLSYKYFLQIGLFSNYSNALRVKRMVSALGEDAKIIKERIGNDTYYRVIIGYFDTSSEAIRKKRELRRKNPQIQAVIKYKKEGN